MRRIVGRGAGFLRGGRWSLLPQRTWSHVIDLLIFAAGLALFYGLITVARTWLGPVTLKVEIDNLLCGGGGQFTTDRLTVQLDAFVPDDNPGAKSTFPATNTWCG